MGTWGTGMFADDTAADVRDDWRELILDGLSPELAKDRILSRWAESTADQDEAVTVWLALAAVQHQTGRLLPEVRDKALSIIDAGGDVARFAEEDPASGRQRRKALDALAAKLRGPERPPTRMVRPKPFQSPLEIGDVVRVRGEDGSSEALLVVVGTTEAYPPGSTAPVLATLLWKGGSIPDAAAMVRLPLLLDDKRNALIRSRPEVFLNAILSPPRGKLAMPESVEIVARRVHRRDVPDRRKWDQRDGPTVGYASWTFLSKWIAGPWFSHQVRLTTEVAAKKRRFSLRGFLTRR